MGRKVLREDISPYAGYKTHRIARHQGSRFLHMKASSTSLGRINGPVMHSPMARRATSTDTLRAQNSPLPLCPLQLTRITRRHPIGNGQERGASASLSGSVYTKRPSRRMSSPRPPLLKHLTIQRQTTGCHYAFSRNLLPLHAARMICPSRISRTGLSSILENRELLMMRASPSYLVQGLRLALDWQA